MRKVILIFGVLVMLFAFSTQATDSPSAGVGTYVTAADIKLWLGKADSNKRSDTIMSMIDAGNANVGVAVVHRPIAAKGQGGDPMQHANVIEIYYVLEGRAVMVTGGKVLNPRPFVQAIVDASSVGPSIRGPSADLAGSESKPIGPGDIIFIPVGTVHYLSEVTEPVTFLVYRIDPNKVTTTHSTPSPVVVP